MQKTIRSSWWPLSQIVLVLALVVLAGCQSSKPKPADHAAPATSAAPAAPAAPATPPAAPTPPPVAATPAADVTPPVAPPVPPPAPPAETAMKPIRIKAGGSAPITDSEGNVWLADTGFTEGDVAERADNLEIANTKTPALYRVERYSMTGFSYPVPNGKYTVKLHFAETFEGITGPGERVFGFNVEGQQFNDFDVWVKAGGPMKAYIETVNVEVTDGKLDITFTSKVENPEINAIEIIPAGS